MEREQAVGLSKAIKSLVVIKILIFPGGEDEIVTHLPKLKQQSPKEELNNAVSHLLDTSPDEVIPAIEGFILKHKKLSIYIRAKLQDQIIKLNPHGIEFQRRIGRGIKSQRQQ